MLYSMKLSQMTLLTLWWLEAIETASDKNLKIARSRLVEYLMSGHRNHLSIITPLSERSI